MRRQIQVILALGMLAVAGGVELASASVMARYFDADNQECRDRLTQVWPRLPLGRVTLRRAWRQDAGALNQLFDDPKIMQYYFTAAPNVSTRADRYRTYALDVVQTVRGPVRAFNFVIERRDTREVIGLGTWQRVMDHAHTWGLGYAIGAKWRRQGYASEVIRGLLAATAQIDPGAIVEARTFNSNVNSHALLSRLGFIEEESYGINEMVWRRPAMAPKVPFGQNQGDRREMQSFLDDIDPFGYGRPFNLIK